MLFVFINFFFFYNFKYKHIYLYKITKSYFLIFINYYFFFWNPLFLKKSYFYVFSLKNNFNKYWYVMLKFNVLKKLKKLSFLKTNEKKFFYQVNQRIIFLNFFQKKIYFKFVLFAFWIKLKFIFLKKKNFFYTNTLFKVPNVLKIFFSKKIFKTFFNTFSKYNLFFLKKKKYSLFWKKNNFLVTKLNFINFGLIKSNNVSKLQFMLFFWYKHVMYVTHFFLEFYYFFKNLFFYIFTKFYISIISNNILDNLFKKRFLFSCKSLFLSQNYMLHNYTNNFIKYFYINIFAKKKLFKGILPNLKNFFKKKKLFKLWFSKKFIRLKNIKKKTQKKTYRKKKIFKNNSFLKMLKKKNYKMSKNKNYKMSKNKNYKILKKKNYKILKKKNLFFFKFFIKVIFKNFFFSYFFSMNLDSCNTNFKNLLKYKKKNFLKNIKKNFFYILINFFKSFLNKKINFFFSKDLIFKKFLKKSFAVFKFFIKKYWKFLKIPKILKQFYYSFLFFLIYKNVFFLKKNLKNLIKLLTLKKQKKLFFFFRYIISNFFKIFYKQLKIMGLQFTFKGKFATLVGGRKKIFKCFFNKWSSTNSSCYFNWININTFTKLGVTNIKILCTFI